VQESNESNVWLNVWLDQLVDLSIKVDHFVVCVKEVIMVLLLQHVQHVGILVILRKERHTQISPFLPEET